MSKYNNLYKSLFSFVGGLLLFSVIQAQEATKQPKGKAIMWERVNIKQLDLFNGPGGTAMRPNLSKITYIKEEKEGFNKKYRIRDGSGRVWVAKLGREAQSETAAVRLLWALGYKTEVNYLVPQITIPGKGTFKNVRLEARPDNIERLDEWSWQDNPFVGTRELQGLRIMMVFFSNWDVGDFQNKVLQIDSKNQKENHYIISDLGATFGRLGNNNLPLIYRFGRTISKPMDYSEAKLVNRVENGEVILAYKGKNRFIFQGISTGDAQWLASLLEQLSDKQIEDAFRAGNFSAPDRKTYRMEIRNRISELKAAARSEKVAGK